MSQPFPWHLVVPFSGCLSLLTLTPEARAALHTPRYTLNWIIVAWLLIAPVVALLLALHSLDAFYIFNTATTLFGIYYKTRIAPKYHSDRTKCRERAALELCGQGHYNRVVESLEMTEDVIGLMPAALAGREEALLHMRGARRAYVGMLDELNRAFLETLKSG
ncbi:hypothetical protein PG984_002840 [Apiospora sp. TS-2023a]